MNIKRSLHHVSPPSIPALECIHCNCCLPPDKHFLFCFVLCLWQLLPEDCSECEWTVNEEAGSEGMGENCGNFSHTSRAPLQGIRCLSGMRLLTTEVLMQQTFTSLQMKSKV